MDSLIQVKQLGNTLFSFLLIPSIFVAIVFLGKLLDSCLSKPAVFNIESFVGLFFATFIGVISWNDQNKSTFLIKNILHGSHIALDLKVSNLSDKEVTLTIDVYDGSSKTVFTNTLEKYKQTNLALQVTEIIANTQSQLFNVKITANTSKNNIVIKAQNNVGGASLEDIETYTN